MGNNPMSSRRDFLKLAALGAGAMVLIGEGARWFSLLSNRIPAGMPIITSGPGTPTDVVVSPTPETTSTQTTILIPISGSAQDNLSPASLTAKPRKLCFVLWDHQLAQYNYAPRNLTNPVPETCPLYSGAKNPVTAAWEAYWRDLLQLCNPKMSKKDFEGSWRSLVASNRAFTNGSGPETGEFALHSITCGGATHEMVTGIPEGKHMRIYTLNSRKAPPPLPARAEDIDITRHFFATTGSNVRLTDGSYAVYGFPQFENCIVPLVSPADTDLIDISRIKVVSAIQRPYNP